MSVKKRKRDDARPGGETKIVSFEREQKTKFFLISFRGRDTPRSAPRVTLCPSFFASFCPTSRTAGRRRSSLLKKSEFEVERGRSRERREKIK